jgi:hypothetical protein
MLCNWYIHLPNKWFFAEPIRVLQGGLYKDNCTVIWRKSKALFSENSFHQSQTLFFEGTFCKVLKTTEKESSWRSFSKIITKWPFQLLLNVVLHNNNCYWKLFYTNPQGKALRITISCSLKRTILSVNCGIYIDPKQWTIWWILQKAS